MLTSFTIRFSVLNLVHPRLHACERFFQRCDFLVSGGELLLGIQRVLVDSLLKKFNVALKTACAPIHSALDRACFYTFHILRPSQSTHSLKASNEDYIVRNMTSLPGEV
jgi:hypothetical protein